MELLKIALKLSRTTTSSSLVDPQSAACEGWKPIAVVTLIKTVPITFFLEPGVTRRQQQRPRQQRHRDGGWQQQQWPSGQQQRYWWREQQVHVLRHQHLRFGSGDAMELLAYKILKCSIVWELFGVDLTNTFCWGLFLYLYVLPVAFISAIVSIRAFRHDTSYFMALVCTLTIIGNILSSIAVAVYLFPDTKVGWSLEVTTVAEFVVTHLWVWGIYLY